MEHADMVRQFGHLKARADKLDARADEIRDEADDLIHEAEVIERKVVILYEEVHDVTGCDCFMLGSPCMGHPPKA